MKWLKILLLFVFAQDLSAQSILRLQRLNVEDGLSQSSVYNIFQDSYGFMWFATGDGINRYDGKEFIVYKSRLNDTNASRLVDRNINSSIFEDGNKRLWMSTDAGISFFDCAHTKFKIALDGYSTAFAIDSNVLWSVTAQHGIYSVNVNSLKSRHYPFTDKWQCDKAHFCGIHNGTGNCHYLWVADNAGLLLFNKKTLEYKRLLVNDKINSVNTLKGGNLLLCSDDGVYVYDTNRNSAKFVEVKRPSSGKVLRWVWAAEDINTRSIYMAARNDGTICRMSLATGKYEFIDFQKGIIYALYIDRSDNLWVGTEGSGVYKLDIKPPKFFCYTPNLPFGTGNAGGMMVKSIYSDGHGKIWIGSFYDGLLKYDPLSQMPEKVSLSTPTDNKLISTIIKDSSARIVISIGTQVVWLDNASEKEITKIDLYDKASHAVNESEIFALVEWKKNHFLVATNIGLYSIKYENGIVQKLFHFCADSNIYSWIYSVHLGVDGTVYVGKRNRNGYAKLRMINDTSFQLLDKGFDHLAIRNFYKCVQNPILWMASEKGLVAYNETTKRYKVFDETSGLSNSCVYAILAQADSLLWISTNHGLSNIHVNYRNLSDIKIDIINYTSKDGLQSNEFNTGASFQGADGMLYFGGITGINWFDPKKIKPDSFEAKPAVTKIFINDSLFADDSAAYIRSLGLLYKRNTISFSLAALEFTRPDQNQFSYKLEGFDKNWVYTTNDKIRYANLPAGNYTFLLKASNGDGVWNEFPLKIHITVFPPWWQTWWFRTLFLSLIFSLIFLIVRFYVRQKVRSKARELDQQRSLYLERLRISKDVHDDLGSGLSKISLMAEMAQNKINKNGVLGNDIKQISLVSKELIENIRDLIWVLNPENTSLDQLVARLREYCADYLDNIPVELKLDFPSSVPTVPISQEVQRSVFLIVKEAINNCIKHAEASTIEVKLNFFECKMIISVTDNGKGFDMAHLKGSGNGLRNMKHRIELIGGYFAISSSQGQTTINISLAIDNLARQNTTLV